MSKILIATLEERVSESGTRRLSGRLGQIRMTAFLDPDAPNGFLWWKLYLEAGVNRTTHRILLSKLRERTAITGSPYLVGRLGTAILLGYRQEGIAGGSNIWRLYVTVDRNVPAVAVASS